MVDASTAPSANPAMMGMFSNIRASRRQCQGSDRGERDRDTEVARTFGVNRWSQRKGRATEAAKTLAIPSALVRLD
jgi:hypothetical protein